MPSGPEACRVREGIPPGVGEYQGEHGEAQANGTPSGRSQISPCASRESARAEGPRCRPGHACPRRHAAVAAGTGLEVVAGPGPRPGLLDRPVHAGGGAGGAVAGPARAQRTGGRAPAVGWRTAVPWPMCCHLCRRRRCPGPVRACMVMTRRCTAATARTWPTSPRPGTERPKWSVRLVIAPPGVVHQGV